MRVPVAASLILGCLVQLSIQQQCSYSNPCPAGCCSSAGFCGYGPEYCGKGCQSTCDRKSDCNPGWDGGEWSKTDKCPLNVCCSKHGFCGYTDEFCEGNNVKRPSCSVGDSTVDRVIGYYEGWASTKRPCYAMRPEEIPFGQYMHLIFSFATVNPRTFQVSPGDYITEDMMRRIGSIKIIQPSIKTWIAIGGWAFNDPGPTQTTFSDIAASEANTEAFLNSLVRMMNKYDFDGVDIDWEYPVATDRHGRGDDYVNIVTFMKRLRRRMDNLRKGVSMALPASYWYLQHFDVIKLQHTVDWFNLMTYDMHGAWDIDNKFTGPWANSHTNMTEIQLGLDLLWRNNISPKKVTIGMSFYSRTFTLTDPRCSKPGCRVSSAGDAGKCSGTAGVMLHAEIQNIIKRQKLTPVLHRKEAVKTLSWGSQWASFDDAVTWRLKSNKLRGQCITGFMVWAISQDDNEGTNAKALTSVLNRPKFNFPNFALRQKLRDHPDLESKTCRWTSCFEVCPTGFKEVQREGHEEIMLDSSHCGGKGHGFSRLCCPASYDAPKCSWRGHRNTGNCRPGCDEFEVEVGTLGFGCKKNHQSACCTDTLVTSLYGKCVWSSCGTKGKDVCTGNNPHFVTSSSIGSGGAGCKKHEKKSLCCVSPTPFDVLGECKWHKKAGFLTADKEKLLCEGACPPKQMRLALESGLTIGNEGGDGCYGTLAYCCAEPARRQQSRRNGDTGSAQGREFRALMEKYMENPTCPATILYPPLHSKFAGRRRSLVIEAAEHNILVGRAKDCTLDTWVRLVQYATLLYSVQRSGMDPLVKVWDEEFAAHYHTSLSFSHLGSFLRRFRGYDPRSVVEWALYNPTHAGTGIRSAERGSQLFCQRPSSRKRPVEASTLAGVIKSRVIDAWNGGDGEVPSLERILRGIADGHLSLHYARWQYFRGQRGGHPEGPMLELAYWIGREPGVEHPDDDVRHYQDTRPRGGVISDRWAVFHLHIDPSRQDWLTEIDGHTYLGVTDFRVYHGQYWQNGQGYAAWRVTNQDHEFNMRDGFNCDRDLDGLWYIGSPRDVSDADAPWLHLLQAWAERIYQQGYVRSPGLALILEPHLPMGHGEEIDSHHPGTLSRGGMSTTAAGRRNPYLLNWIMDRGTYNFFPACPPQDRLDPNAPTSP